MRTSGVLSNTTEISTPEKISHPLLPHLLYVGGDQLEYKRLVADHVGDTYLR